LLLLHQNITDWVNYNEKKSARHWWLTPAIQLLKRERSELWFEANPVKQFMTPYLEKSLHLKRGW
jgi:hypothetical protein